MKTCLDLCEDWVPLSNATGVFVGFDAFDTSVVDAHFNCIVGNDTGVQSTAPEVDAIENWWGDASGPSGEGPGTGDAVSEHVLFDPWLTEANCGPDEDGDGVPDLIDECPGTGVDSVPTQRWGSNRWKVSDNGFDWVQNAKGKGQNKSYTMADTRGCNAEQILDMLRELTGGNFNGHYKFGLSNSLIQDWVDGPPYQ